MTGAPLAVVDCESTGLDRDLHEPYEMAVITVDGRNTREYRWWLPVDLTVADPYALTVGRFHQRRPHRAERDRAYRWEQPEGATDGSWKQLDSVAQAAEQIADVLRGRHLVGAVPNFDDNMLWRFLRRNGQCPGEWHYHLADVENLVVGYMAAKGEIVRPPWSSSDLSVAVGVEPSDYERHSALDDCRWALAIWRAVMG